MAGLFNPAPVSQCSLRLKLHSNLPEHPLHPRYDLMTGRVRGFVEVDDTRGNVGFKVALERGATAWNWNEMAGSHEH